MIRNPFSSSLELDLANLSHSPVTYVGILGQKNFPPESTADSIRRVLFCLQSLTPDLTVSDNFLLPNQCGQNIRLSDKRMSESVKI